MNEHVTASERTATEDLSHCVTPLMSPTRSDLGDVREKPQKALLTLVPTEKEATNEKEDGENKVPESTPSPDEKLSALSFANAIIEDGNEQSEEGSSQYTAQKIKEEDEPIMIAHEMLNYPDSNDIREDRRTTAKFNMLVPLRTKEMETNFDAVIEKRVLGDRLDQLESSKNQDRKPHSGEKDTKNAADSNQQTVKSVDVAIQELSETNTLRNSNQSLMRSPEMIKDQKTTDQALLKTQVDNDKGKVITFAPNSMNNLDVDKGALPTLGAGIDGIIKITKKKRQKLPSD